MKIHKRQINRSHRLPVEEWSALTLNRVGRDEKDFHHQ